MDRMDTPPFDFPILVDRKVLNTMESFSLSVPQKGRSLLAVTAGELRILPDKAGAVSFFVSAGHGIFPEKGITYQLQNMTPNKEAAFFCLTYPEDAVSAPPSDSVSAGRAVPVSADRAVPVSDPIFDPASADRAVSVSAASASADLHSTEPSDEFVTLPFAPAVSDAISLSDRLRINSAMEFIESHYADPLTLDDIASHIYVGREECCRCFKRALKLSPFEYLTRFRLEKALEWLGQKETASQTISELAALAGFNNPSYFAKLFRETFHCTPSQYRKKMNSVYSS